MNTVSSTSRVRKAKTTVPKTCEQLKKFRDRAAPHITRAVAETARISRRVSEKLPEDAKLGFVVGHKAGNDAVIHGVPYAAGATVGFGFGAIEAVVGLLAKPANYLLGIGVGLAACATRAIQRGSPYEDESAGGIQSV